MTTIAITGAAGRMGQRLIALGKQSGDFDVVAAIDRGDSPSIDRDAGEIAGVGKIGVPITSDLRATPQVMIDFTAPAATRHWLKTCRDRGIALVIGTTGLQASDHAIIDQAAADIAVLQAPNMSLGVNLLFKVAAQVAKMLGDDYDIEIVEGHHRFKKDAPSGTAMGLAEAILASTGKTKDALIYDRHGDEAVRNRGEIGMHALRIGDEVGRHTAYFAALGERLELTHVATNRDTFAHGALRAAKWLADKKPGRYTVADVLGL
ncbi:MAG TPA: 4-hydroxy-tetrahydrodipicolinate reductase [Tepidisphaeraceae bacterium]|jgi:4-hydroxy-tetrahydrodipicolinate reductase|nr:4-hydroxy-tetrahydrodipicolinate reductase [Tepidisphaeraceae bacterium]